MSNVFLFGPPLWRLLHSLPSTWRRVLQLRAREAPHEEEDDAAASSSSSDDARDGDARGDGASGFDAMHDSIAFLTSGLLWTMPCGVCLASLRVFFPETLATFRPGHAYHDIEGVLADGPFVLRDFLYALHQRVNVKLLSQRIEAAAHLTPAVKAAALAAVGELTVSLKPDVHDKWFLITDAVPVSDADCWVLAEAMALQAPCIETARLVGVWLAALVAVLRFHEAAWEDVLPGPRMASTARRLLAAARHIMVLCTDALRRGGDAAGGVSPGVEDVFPAGTPLHDTTLVPADELWARRRAHTAALHARAGSAARVAAQSSADVQARLGDFLLTIVLAARYDVSPLPATASAALSLVETNVMLHAAHARACLLRAGSCVTSCS